jgi:hypothetical protein
MVTLSSVIIYDVKDHFYSFPVEFADHCLEFRNLLTQISGTAVMHFRRKKTNRVIAPVICKPFFNQAAVCHEMVYRHQFHGCYAEREDMLYYLIMYHTWIGTPDFRGHRRVKGRKPFYM